MRDQAKALRSTSPQLVRQYVPDFSTMTDEDILKIAAKLDEQAISAHPLPGFWDGMGNPLDQSPTVSGVQTNIGLSKQPNTGFESPQVGGDYNNNDVGNVGSKSSSHTAQESRLTMKAEQLRDQAAVLRRMGPAAVRHAVKEFAHMTDEELYKMADLAEQAANSPTALAALVKQEEQEGAMGQNVHGEQHMHQQQLGKKGQEETPERQMRLEQEVETAQDFVEASIVESPGRQEAAVWAAAVTEHQEEGHRAFTGAGYQAQHGLVQEKLRQLKKASEQNSGDAVIESGKIGGKSTFIEALSKAVFGPPGA